VIRMPFCLAAAGLVGLCLAFGGEPLAATPAASQRAEPSPTSHPAADPRRWCTPGAETPVAYGGLHNVFWPLPALVSGSAPETDVDFAAIRALGVRAVVSVDGAPPDVEAARRAGLKYVHIPIQYGGVDETQRRMLAQAMRDLPKPVYVHCHHGKHRGPAAAAVAAVAVGWWTPEQAVAFLKQAGTSSNYPGLYEAARTGACLSDEELARLDERLSEIAPTGDLAKAMVAIDLAAEHLDVIQKAGWKTPASHPDLVAAAEAGRITELLRGHFPTSQPATDDGRVARWRLAVDAAVALEAAIAVGGPERCDAALAALRTQCAACHRVERDFGLRPR
jgi:hypothetical protein